MIEPATIEWAVAAQPMPGEILSGDAHVVAEFLDGVLIAVVDALGHGAEAHEVARLAVSTLEAHADEEPTALIMRCHARMRGTRGAAISIVSIRPVQKVLTWVGVGNVEALLMHPPQPGAGLSTESVVLRSGVVGYQLPELRASTYPVDPWDLLILATDGVRPDFREGVRSGDPAQKIAELVLARNGTKRDDALVLVARLLPGRA